MSLNLAGCGGSHIILLGLLFFLPKFRNFALAVLALPIIRVLTQEGFVMVLRRRGGRYFLACTPLASS